MELSCVDCVLDYLHYKEDTQRYVYFKDWSKLDLFVYNAIDCVAQLQTSICVNYIHLLVRGLPLYRS